MQNHLALSTPKPVRTTLWVDAALEAVIAAVLLAAASNVAGWYGLAAGWSLAAGGVFVAAALGVGYLAKSRDTDTSLVRALAFANIAGGAAGWLLLVSLWGSIDAPGRWFLGAASDSFILVGVLELVALRRSA